MRVVAEVVATLESLADRVLEKEGVDRRGPTREHRDDR
jgi:hypothetical protein